MIKRGEAEAAGASLACDCLLQQERNDTNENRKSSIHKEQQLLDLPPDSFRKGQMYRMEGFMHACMDKKMLSEQFRNKYFYGGKHQRESEILRFLRRYFFHLILYSWPMKIVWLWRLWCDSPLMASEASPSQQCQNHQISTSNSFFLGKESSFLREKGNCLWCLNSNPIPGDPKLILISFRKEVTFHQNWDFFTQFPTLCGNVITTYQFQEVLKE